MNRDPSNPTDLRQDGSVRPAHSEPHGPALTRSAEAAAPGQPRRTTRLPHGTFCAGAR